MNDEAVACSRSGACGPANFAKAEIKSPPRLFSITDSSQESSRYNAKQEPVTQTNGRNHKTHNITS